MVVDLTIDKLVQGGDGLAQLDGLKVFVPYAAPQERVRARIVARKKDYAVASILEVIEPSPLRVEPRCPHFGECGGCQLQHIDYQGQLVAKKMSVNETLQRVGKVFVPVRNITGESEPWHYRNKTQYPVAAGPRPRIGFFRRSSHDIVEVDSCLLHPPEFDSLRRVVLESSSSAGEAGYDEATGTGNIRHIVLRRATPGSDILAAVVTRTEKIEQAVVDSLAAQPGVVGVVQSVNPERTNRIMGRPPRVLSGTGELTFMIMDRPLRVSAASFFQVNSSQAEELCRRVVKHVMPATGETILDLYSGVGMLSLVMVDSAREVIGIEVDPTAVEDARFNAATAGAANTRFICGDVDRAIDSIDHADAVVLDPPRKGCSARTLARIAGLRPRCIVYVSCNAATLARDLALLGELGYSTHDVEPVDMFPQTHHVEVVACLRP